jgi:dsDNA-binding SOS-regulon protein
VVTKANGQQQTFGTKHEADIYATMAEGKVTVRKK